MITSVIEGIRIAGIRAVVPPARHSFLETPEPFTADEVGKLCASIGVDARRVAPLSVCASDLCVAAAEGLLTQLNWDPASVGVLILVTQDPDYNVPATACVIHKRLGLSSSAACFDVNLGCSGFVYGVWMASLLMRGSSAKRALVLCGDVPARRTLLDDRGTRPLFGDAGSATALEVSDGAAPIHALVGTDGNGARNIFIKAGARRNDLTPGLVARTPEEAAALHADARLSLNGAEVFSFTLRVVPGLIRDALAFAGTAVEAIDHCVMHQANAFMLEHLRKKTKFPEEKFVVAMKEFGNTSSASIPLSIAHRLSASVASGSRKVLLAGFGVGWSWGALVGDLGPIPAPEVVDLPEDFPVLKP
jgi:3-oxoacyl-[acyl-carrier-protein] synthase III